MKNFTSFDWIAVAILTVGGINWGMIGAFNIDLVSSLFGEMTMISRAIYTLVGISALYTILAATFSSAETSNRLAHS